MGLGNLMGMLSQYAGGGSGNLGNVENDFDHVSQNADPSHLAGGLSGAFRSGGSSFPQTIGNLFSNSNGQQQAGILGHLMQAAGPAAAGGVLGNLFGGGMPSGGQFTPEQAQQVSPQAVQQLAQHAQQNDPSIMDTAGQFYSQHPTVVKALGAGALAMVMSHMSQR